MGYGKFRVIDADSHLQDVLSHWVDYVEPKYWERRPRIRIVEEAGGEWGLHYAELLPCELNPNPPRYQVGGGNTRTQGITEGSGGTRKGREELRDYMPKKYGEAYYADFDAQSRIKDMDKYGWDKMVCIPTASVGSLGWSRVEGREQAYLWALARAWHNWCRDFCDADPKRLYMVADMPNQHDIEGMVTEARRAVGELNAVTVMMPKATKERPWESEEYFPFYNLAQELDFPVSFHGVMSRDPHTASRYQPRTTVPGQQVAMDHAIGFPFENMISMAHLIYMGVLDKFPNMRVSFLEGNAGWLPWWIGRLDDHALATRRQGMWYDAPLLTMSPSEYFRRQGFVACDGDEWALSGVIDQGWDDNVVWNTDYPHPDAPDPGDALGDFLKQPISDQAKEKILWDNPARLYGERLVN